MKQTQTEEISLSTAITGAALFVGGVAFGILLAYGFLI